MRFAAAKLMSLCCEVALVCQTPLSQLRNSLRNGTFGAKSCFSISQCTSQLPNRCYCTAEWHSCAKPHFRSCEIPSQRLLQCCGMVWQQNAHFAEVSFMLRNFAELCFSLVFALFSLQIRLDFFFFSIFLKFLPPGIIQNN